jgi:hypothetical protein
MVMVCVVPDVAVGEAFGEGLGVGLGAGDEAGDEAGLGVGDAAGLRVGDEAAVGRGDDAAIVGSSAALGVAVAVAWEAVGDADRAAAVAAGEAGVAPLGVLAAGVGGAVVASEVTGAACCALDPPQAAAAVSTAATVSSRQCTRMGADWPRPPTVTMGHWS